MPKIVKERVVRQAAQERKRLREAIEASKQRRPPEEEPHPYPAVRPPKPERSPVGRMSTSSRSPRTERPRTRPRREGAAEAPQGGGGRRRQPRGERDDRKAVALSHTIKATARSVRRLSEKAVRVKGLRQRLEASALELQAAAAELLAALRARA